jgi:hypothetical protein
MHFKSLFLFILLISLIIELYISIDDFEEFIENILVVDKSKKYLILSIIVCFIFYISKLIYLVSSFILYLI